MWRLSRARHAASPLNGEGARRLGGRWNPKGVPLVYASSTLSLACLELLVHADPRELPDDLRALAIEIPEDLPRRVLAPESLPRDWNTTPAPESLRLLGGAWAAGRTEAVLVVPSAVIPEEQNILINPAHPGAAALRVVQDRPFRFDPRLGVRG